MLHYMWDLKGTQNECTTYSNSGILYFVNLNQIKMLYTDLRPGRAVKIGNAPI